METLRSRILELISDGKTDKALDVFEEDLREKKHPLHKELAIINGEFNDLNKNLRTNLISNEDAQRAKNRINDSIIVILDQTEDQQLVNPAKQDLENSSIVSKLKSGLVLTVVGSLVFVILVLSLVLLNKFNGLNGTPDNSVSDQTADVTNQIIPGTSSNDEPENSGEDTVETIEPVEVATKVSNNYIDDNETVGDLVINELGLTIYNQYKDVYLHQSLADPDDQQIFKDKRAEVRTNTKRLVKNLKRVKDDNIELHSKIYKYIGLLISNKILSLTSFDSTSQITLTNMAFGYVDKLDGFIEEIDDIEDTAFQQDLQDWIDDEEHEARILVNKFICMVVNYRAGGETKKEDIVNLYEEMERDNDVLKRQGYHIYPIIKWLFDNEIVEHNH